MPNLWDKLPDVASQPDLNPLTNRTLEQNLDRWAKVYFSNPPGKREQALMNLLEELKRESAAGTAAEPAQIYFAGAKKLQEVACPTCQHQNPAGHKFCSRCGGALNTAQSDSRKSESSRNLNVDATPSSEAASARPQNEVAWLRDRALSGLESPDVPSRRGWKYMVGALAIGLAGLAYLEWAPGPSIRVASPSSTVAPASSAPATPLPVENSSVAESKPSETASPVAKGPETRNSSAKAEAQDRSAVPSGVQVASQKSPLPDKVPAPRAVEVAEGGSSDLRLAQRYLGGSTSARDSAEAAKWLWKAVGKQNATAAVLLSDLYLRGDGVPKSCDQARLLLVAAAKRGSPQAAQQLRNLESGGCR